MKPAEEDIIAVTVLLVDAHAIWRSGIKSMLEDTEFQVVGEAASCQEALEVARRVCPQLTLLDFHLPDSQAVTTLCELKQEYPQMRVVMLTTYDNPTFMARPMMWGATEYLVKGIDRDAVLRTLRMASCTTHPPI